MMMKLLEILARLLLVCFLLLVAVWQTALYIIELVGAILYNIGNIVPFEKTSWKETKSALKDLKYIPIDVYEALINILKGGKK